jgi:hypothetical protein
MSATKDSETKRKVYKGRELGHRMFGEMPFIPSRRPLIFEAITLALGRLL